MATNMDFGLPAVPLAVGDHICGFFRGPAARDEILLPYLTAGLDAGDKCTCVVDGQDPTDVVDDLRAAAAVQSKQLDVRRSSDTYLLDGHFSTSRMIGFWDAIGSEATNSGGYQRARSVGEMSWSLRDMPGVDELATYESELNDFMPRYPQVLLCLYDIDQFGGGIIVDMLKTHPRVLLGGIVIENPFYLTPEEFAASRS